MFQFSAKEKSDERNVPPKKRKILPVVDDSDSGND